MVTEEMVRDRRLTHRDLRVLLALLLHCDASGRCWPKRDSISEMTGMAPNKVSATTTRLGSLGWLKKSGDGGRNKSAHYQINATRPSLETLPKPGTLSGPETLPKSGSETLPKSGTLSGETLPKTGSETLPKLGRRNEQTIEQTKKKREEPPMVPRSKKPTAKFAPPDTISPDVWTDFEEHRKRLRAPMTDRARRGIVSQLDKLHADTGRTRDDLLDHAITSGWRKPFPIRDNDNDRPNGSNGNGRRKTQAELYHESMAAAREKLGIADPATIPDPWDEDPTFGGRTFDG